MSFLDRLKPKKIKQRSQSSQDFYSGVDLNEGIQRIDIDTSLKLSVVQGCVKVLSEDIASLPLFIYKDIKGGKEKAKDHELYNLLHLAPNAYMDSFTFFSTAMTQALLWGNCYCEIVYKKGKVESLFLLPPAKTQKMIIKGKPWYKVKVGNEDRFLRDEYVLHIMYMSKDGVSGISPIEEAADVFNLSYFVQTYSKKLFENGTNTGGVLEHPGNLSDAAGENLRKSFNINKGLENSHRMMILEEGMKYSKMSIPPNDAQMIESRKFQIEDIARIYRVPLHLIQSLDHATNNNIEHQSLDYVTHTLRPWLVRWERQLKLKLFFGTDYSAEFKVDGLLRGDYKTRMEGYGIGRQNGFLTVNEIRALENMNSVPEGDTFLQPLNMQELGENNQKVEKKSTEPTEKRAKDETKDEKRRRFADKRHDLTLSFQPLMKKAFEAIAKREKADIMRKIEKMRDKPAEDVKDYIRKFYSTHDKFVVDKVLPVAESLSIILEQSAAEEVDSKPDKKESKKIALEFTNSYAEKYIIRHRSQLLGLVNENRADEEPEYITAIEERVGEWVEKQPEKSSLETIVQLAGFVVATSFFNRGKKIIWMNTGSDSCPYCKNLDGKIVGRDEPFVNDGSKVLDMVVSGAKFHPPLHQGCVCQIGPE